MGKRKNFTSARLVNCLLQNGQKQKRGKKEQQQKKRSENFFPLNFVLGFKLLDMRACGLVASGFGIAAGGYGWKGPLFLC